MALPAGEAKWKETDVAGEEDLGDRFRSALDDRSKLNGGFTHEVVTR